jgi:hypothetical protein
MKREKKTKTYKKVLFFSKINFLESILKKSQKSYENSSDGVEYFSSKMSKKI